MTSTVLTVICVVCVLIAALVGALRDLRRGVLALAGTLLGANLVYIWSEWLVLRTNTWFEGNNPQTWALVLHVLAFGVTLLIVGYGGGLLLSKPTNIVLRERLFTTLLGLVTGLLIVGYALQFAARVNKNALALIEAQPWTRLFYVGLPYVLAAVPLIIALMLIGRGLIALSHRAPAPAASTAPQAKPAVTTATQPKPAATQPQPQSAPPPQNPPR